VTFQYHPEAAKELTSSIRYYEDKSAGPGAEFLDEIEEAIAQALAHPQSGSLLTKEDRRILLDRFPFEIIYDVSEHIITITAVKHMKRKPGYWESRK